MKNEQLSFLTNTKEIITIKNSYGTTICYRCCCRKCKYSVEIYPFLTTEECKEIGKDGCFNCDECYYYGMDDENLSRNKVKFQCDKFEMSNYYKELEVKKRRKSFKII
ncbi:hypothetical protein K144316041_23630 [Clostridium tetani]|uniref:Uncharacterized protein n=1 Tax=Clostridium tetani TaxID=1513 RepID=A0ABY0ERD6_CLOTA|nr:hypothetical protein [Clostridium tetani]RXI54631.1 hypothetical protein DP131_09680 [Clostridium tetani]RXI67008.1 hypothetical protein DQN76_12750 [Clostridium tetani]BDR67000.1 hypothetical protein K144312032_12280 [Clostridium tetani]BDR73655.1 hypothetical protein K144316041_23630 [Clostridium tetani]